MRENNDHLYRRGLMGQKEFCLTKLVTQKTPILFFRQTDTINKINDHLSGRGLVCPEKTIVNKTGVINDPLGQTHSVTPATNIVFCCFVCLLKSGDGRTDNM